MFYFNMQSKSHYLQFCIKRNIGNVDEQKHISQLSQLIICLGQTFKAQISSMILLENILLGKCVLVGLLVTKALNKVIQ